MLLYTIGDSFTYGEELPTPSTQSWPALLSNKLNYDLINCGKPGTGNNYIIKTAIKQIPKLKPDLVIVAWTSCGRMEFADQHGVYDISSGWNRRFKKSYPYREILMKYITSYNNELHQYRSWLRSVILLQDFLKLRKDGELINDTISLWTFIQEFIGIQANSSYDYLLMNYLEYKEYISHGSGIRCAWLKH